MAGRNFLMIECTPELKARLKAIKGIWRRKFINWSYNSGMAAVARKFIEDGLDLEEAKNKPKKKGKKR